MSKLEDMLKYVSEHNDFYKNRIKEYGIENPLDITQWPILTRKELQENRYNMFSDGYQSKYFNQQLRRQSSSGSSGIPVNVYWDYKDWYASNMSLWRKRLQWYGIKPSDRHVMFTLNAFGIKNDGETVYYIKDPANVLSVNVSLIQNDKSWDKLIDVIDDFNPKWFYIQPSVLNRLIQAFARTKKSSPQSLSYIESVGEILSSDLRKRAIEFFDVSFANMYGSEEMNGIAYECPEHHMHILEDNVCLEIFNGSDSVPSSRGEAVITNLNNHSMPLIRYSQGDEIAIGEKEDVCPYAGSSLVLKSVLGRTLDSVMIGNVEINSSCLLEIMSDAINQFNELITGYNYIYSKSTGKLICKVVLSKKYVRWFPNIEKAVINVFSEKTGIDEKVDFEVKLEQRLGRVEKKQRILEIIE